MEAPVGRVSDDFVSLEETGEIRATENFLVGGLEATSEDKTNVKEVMKQKVKTGSSTFPG